MSTRDVSTTEKTSLLAVDGASRAIDLVCGGRVEVLERASGSVVRLSALEGQGSVTIQFTDRGPLVTLSGADVEISATKTLSLSSDELVVNARKARIDIAEDFVQRVGGEAKLHVRRGYEVKSSTLDLEAVRGSASIKANDDVDVRGERVRMNCDDPPMPLSIQEFEARRATLVTSTEVADTGTPSVR